MLHFIIKTRVLISKGQKVHFEPLPSTHTKAAPDPCKCCVARMCGPRTLKPPDFCLNCFSAQTAVAPPRILNAFKGHFMASATW